MAIVGTTASSSIPPSSFSLSAIIDQSGLSTPNSLTSTFGAQTASSIWRANNVQSGTIDFTFPQLHCLSGLSFWSAFAGFDSFGIKDVLFFSSLDGTVFEPIAGGPTVFAQRTEAGPLSPETFSFPPILAHYVRMTFSSIYQTSGGNVQIDEIMFGAADSILECAVGNE